jgi:hypothetical protein
MDIKFNCSNPDCRQRIAVDESMAGRPMPCPVCATVLQVPGSSDIKLYCSNPDCEQHIVIDVSHAGRFIPCPSCGKPIAVPGIPSKPIVFKHVIQTREQRLGMTAVDERLISISPFKRLLYGWGVGVAICGVLSAAACFHQRIILPTNHHAEISFDAMADAIFAVGEFRGAPAPNHAGTALVYPRNVKDGGGIFLADLTTQRSSLLMTQKEGANMDFAKNNMFGWSPDDRYLVLSHRIALNRPNQQFNICDPYTGSLRQTIDLPEAIEEVVWLNTSSLAILGHSGAFYLVYLHNDASLSRVRGKAAKKLKMPALDNAKNEHWLTCISENSLAYINNGNIWTLDFSTGQVRQLTQFTGSTLEWLDYNPNTGEFLFNLSDEKKRRALYCLNPNLATNNINAVTSVNISQNGNRRIPIANILKGQWVLGGNGVAFVKGSLFVDAEDESFSTNLFPDGYVQSFSVAASQDKIYAVAALGAEPLGIWEYDIRRRELRNIVPGTQEPFVLSQTIPTEKTIVGAPDSKSQITFSFLPAANLDEHKKYPAIVRSRSGGSYWTPDTQLFAHAGIFYAYVPNRSNVTNADGLSVEAREMLTAYYLLRDNPNVDPHRIYMMGASHRTEEMTELLTYDPSLWRGAIFEAPVRFPNIPDNPVNFPSIFITIGVEDAEQYRKTVEDFTQTAWRQRLPVRLRYAQNGGHILASTDILKERYKAIIKFILEDY